ncbi:MAG: hypothetical protein JRH12_05435 [Deltaproteobacteria bacterium]|jgi:hypothetical protein|nr:hypothetical protein [Deltaproteobacteria bacterium]MBW2483273.1 hypothetical protein [Deltaproteobacteria bacterium]
MTNLKIFKMAIAILLTMSLVPLAFAGEPRSKKFLPDIPQTWTEIVPEPTEFMGRELTPTCIGMPFTDPTFSFFVKGGTVNNLVVFFDGGGACWHSMNTIYAPTCSQEVDESVEELEMAGGIFDTDNPANPFKDWSFVTIPYCTGDIHWGSNDYDYPLIGGGYVTAHHRGFDNFLVVLKWMTENFRRPHKIFVTGSSAGSYGATLGFPYIQEAFPKSKASLLGDAGNGVVTEEFQTNDINNWGIQDNLPAWIPGFDRPFSEYELDEMYLMIADYYPRRKIAQYTTAWDWNQTFFYNVMLNVTDPSKWEEWPLVWCDWHDRMLELVDSAADAPNYRYYIGAGDAHTIMGYDKFYTEDSAGVPFVDWVGAMVRNQGGTGGHGGIPWENVECEDCGDPLPCP